VNARRAPEPELLEREVPSAPDTATLVAINRAEIDGQIATARAFPRSNSAFIKEARELVTLDADMAEACIYALPRDGKTVTGPSARFAEIIQHTYGNNRGGGRVVAEEGSFIVAQGVFHDLEKNVMVTMEVRRRITDKYGRRFKDDMITVTGNAAAAIAHRNSVLKGVPKALWLPIYEAARMAAVGDITTLSRQREMAVAWFAKAGVTPAMICAKLGVGGVDDIGLDQLETLVGLKTAMREGTRPEDAFAVETAEASGHNTTTTGGLGTVTDKLTAKRAAKQAEQKAEPPAAADTGPTVQEIHDAIAAAQTREALDEAADLIRSLPEAEQAPLRALYDTRVDALELPA
jgi:hypothetical protein